MVPSQYLSVPGEFGSGYQPAGVALIAIILSIASSCNREFVYSRARVSCQNLERIDRVISVSSEVAYVRIVVIGSLNKIELSLYPVPRKHLENSRVGVRMSEQNPFDDIESPVDQNKLNEEKKALKEARKKAKLTLELESEELELDKKPAKILVLPITFLLLIGAIAFSMKPVSFTQKGESQYAITVRLILTGPELVKNECRPIGANAELADTVITLKSLARGTSYNRQAKLPFTEVSFTEDQTGCYFPILFSGVTPADGVNFEVSAQILDTYLNKSYQRDTALQLPRIMFEVN